MGKIHPHGFFRRLRLTAPFLAGTVCTASAAVIAPMLGSTLGEIVQKPDPPR
jgi:hypothetical protein